jgi:methanogenic corrinoid protein MtbC1
MYHVQTMYNIKQAAERAGVSVPVLRAWERRYGIVKPERSPSGYRRFDDESIARVRAMRTLVHDGWSPSAAAAAILEGRAPVEVSVAEPTASTPRDSDAAIPGDEQLGDRFVRAAAALDAGAVDEVLDDLFSRGSFERVAADLLFPALRRLGNAWATGEVSVAGEHLASNAVLRRLGQALEAAGSRASAEGRVVVGLPPGSRHELGALAFAVAARRAGLGITYLGPDLPVADWLTAAVGAAGAVVGVVSARDRRSALQVARALRSAEPRLIVAFGGPSAPEEPGVLRLDAALPTAVANLSRELAARTA